MTGLSTFDVNRKISITAYNQDVQLTHSAISIYSVPCYFNMSSSYGSTTMCAAILFNLDCVNVVAYIGSELYAYIPDILPVFNVTYFPYKLRLYTDLNIVVSNDQVSTTSVVEQVYTPEISGQWNYSVNHYARSINYFIDGVIVRLTVSADSGRGAISYNTSWFEWVPSAINDSCTISYSRNFKIGFITITNVGTFNNSNFSVTLLYAPAGAASVSIPITVRTRTYLGLIISGANSFSLLYTNIPNGSRLTRFDVTVEYALETTVTIYRSANPTVIDEIVDIDRVDNYIRKAYSVRVSNSASGVLTLVQPNVDFNMGRGSQFSISNSAGGINQTIPIAPVVTPPPVTPVRPETADAECQSQISCVDSLQLTSHHYPVTQVKNYTFGRGHSEGDFAHKIFDDVNNLTVIPDLVSVSDINDDHN